MTRFWMYSFDGLKSTDDFAERKLFQTRNEAEAAAMRESLETGVDLSSCVYYYVMSKASNFVKPEPMGVEIGGLVEDLISDISDMPDYMALSPERKAKASRSLDIRMAEMMSFWIFEELDSKRAIISIFEPPSVPDDDDDDSEKEIGWGDL